MGAGIEVFREDGTLLFDATSRLYRVLSVANAGSGGSFTHPELLRSTAALAVAPSDPGKVRPTFTVSGDTLTWGFSGSSGEGGPDTDALLYVMAY